MAAIDSLPQHIVELIVMEASGELDSATRLVPVARAALQLGLVCRRWLEAGRSVALRTIHLDADMEDQMGKDFVKIVPLGSLLATTPTRLVHLRVLSVATHLKQCQAVDSLITLVGIFATGLQSLSLELFVAPSSVAVASLSQRRLHEICIMGTAFDAKAAVLASMLAGPTGESLRNLVTWRSAFDDEENWAIAVLRGRALPSLQRWHLGVPHEGGLKSVAPFAMDAPLLHTLHTNSIGLDWILDFTSLADQIRTLEVGHSRGSSGSRLRSLRNLDVVKCALADLTPRFLQNLPLRLVEFRLTMSIERSSHTIRQWLEDDGVWQHRRLTRLVIQELSEVVKPEILRWLEPICKRRAIDLRCGWFGCAYQGVAEP